MHQLPTAPAELVKIVKELQAGKPDGWPNGIHSKNANEVEICKHFPVIADAFLALQRQAEEQGREIVLLKQLLHRSLKKLRKYYEQTDGEYYGGENTGWLTDDIEKVLPPRSP